MSYDINFWKQTRRLDLSPNEIYQKISAGEAVEGLAGLPVDTILAQLREAFPSFDPNEQFPLVETEHGSCEISWSRQHFRFDIRGEWGHAEPYNTIIRIMGQFDCPLYDSQEGKRYDAEGGTALGDTPRFPEVSPEKRAEVERIKAEALAKIDVQFQRKKGCAAPATVLLLLALLIALAITTL